LSSPEEHAIYSDVTLGGPWTLLLRVIAARPLWIFEARLALQLPGMPLDPSPLRLTLADLGVEGPLFLNGLSEYEQVETIGFRANAVAVEPLADVVADDDDDDDDTNLVSGLVVRNPFRIEVAGDAASRAAAAIGRSDPVPATLGSWFSVERRPPLFYLKAVEILAIADARLVRVVVDW
jgi:hypothetical protein